MEFFLRLKKFTYVGVFLLNLQQFFDQVLVVINLKVSYMGYISDQKYDSVFFLQFKRCIELFWDVLHTSIFTVRNVKSVYNVTEQTSERQYYIAMS